MIFDTTTLDAAQKELGFFRKIDRAESFHYLKGQLHHSMVVPRSIQVSNQGPDFCYCIPGKYLVCSSKSLPAASDVENPVQQSAGETKSGRRQTLCIPPA